MAVIPRPRVFWDPQQRVEVQGDFTVNGRVSLGDATLESTEDDVIITTAKGKKISVSGLLERLEALETAYMEDKLLGEDSGKIGK